MSVFLCYLTSPHRVLRTNWGKTVVLERSFAPDMCLAVLFFRDDRGCFLDLGVMNELRLSVEGPMEDTQASIFVSIRAHCHGRVLEGLKEGTHTGTTQRRDATMFRSPFPASL